jgi:hypothetical protein
LAVAAGRFFLGRGFVVCASSVPAAIARTVASKHNLIKCFFISLVLSYKKVLKELPASVSRRAILKIISS